MFFVKPVIWMSLILTLNACMEIENKNNCFTYFNQLPVDSQYDLAFEKKHFKIVELLK